MKLSNHEELARTLLEAEKRLQPIRPLTDDAELDIDDAYQIQILQIEEKVKAGSKIVGKKIGLTSKAMQNMFHVNQPDFGHLLDTMMHVDGEVISINQFIQPKLESEIGFVLKEDLQGPGVSIVDVLRATDYIVPAFEIIDSRIKDWKIKFEDTVADNGSSARAVLGGTPTAIHNLDLAHIGMVVYQNGEQIATAAGAAVLKSPLHAVAWLANALGKYDIPLKAGEIILSGAFTAAVPIHAGDTFTAEFAHIGSVTVSFKEGE
ncbi:2-keto-4-pentenoate hydratase [Microbacteriaceae bacterium 4G12]